MSFSIPSTIPTMPAAPPAAKIKAEKAAQDFEAVLLSSLLESLQKSFAGNAEDASAGSDNYAAMGTQALASALSTRGGLGIAQMILRQWQQTKVPALTEPGIPPVT